MLFDRLKKRNPLEIFLIRWMHFSPGKWRFSYLTFFLRFSYRLIGRCNSTLSNYATVGHFRGRKEENSWEGSKQQRLEIVQKRMKYNKHSALFKRVSNVGRKSFRILMFCLFFEHFLLFLFLHWIEIMEGKNHEMKYNYSNVPRFRILLLITDYNNPSFCKKRLEDK